MKKSVFILSLMSGVAFAGNVCAADCPAGTTLNTNCWSCGSNCKASLVDGTLTISGTGDMRNYGVNGTPWYSSLSSIQSIVVDKGITSIGQYTFCGASNLTSVTIPDSVTNIREYAFQNAAKLTSVIMPNSITSIGDAAFYNTKLPSVVIPDSVTSIGKYAFQTNSSLKSVVIPDSVTSIGYMAFMQDQRLESVVLPASITIESDAFYNTPSSAQIYCPDQACRTAVKNAGYGGSNFVYYTKGNDGIYTSGGIMYASAEDMQTGASASCGNHDACVAKVQEYKEAKATQMAQNGVLCQTKQGCLNLMDMVSNDTYECTTIATCSAAVKNGTITGVNLAAADPVGGSTGGSSAGSGKRIYTVEEARAAVEAAGTDTVNFRIRYK